MYIVMTSSEKMPAKCWGQYRRVAVVKLALGTHAMPKMISDRARGVAEICREWRKLSVGKTQRCAYRRALADAERIATELNLAHVLWV